MRKKFTKPRVFEVTVVRVTDNSTVEAHFTYDVKIVDIMRKLKGRYRRMPVPHWEFPLKEEQEVIDALKRAKLKVTIMQKRQDFPG